MITQSKYSRNLTLSPVITRIYGFIITLPANLHNNCYPNMKKLDLATKINTVYKMAVLFKNLPFPSTITDSIMLRSSQMIKLSLIDFKIFEEKYGLILSKIKI